MLKPSEKLFTIEEIQRVKNNLNCRYCTGRKHTKESRCGRCREIADYLRENKNKKIQLSLFNL